MGKAIIGLLGLVVGLVVGVFGGGALTGGSMMGIGVATGLSAGVCATIQAAQEEGLMSAEQVDQVLLRAAKDLGGAADLPEGAEMVGSAEQCKAVMDKLKTASSS